MNILPVAFNTFKEAIRDKILYVILVFSLVMIFSSILLSFLSIGQEIRVIINIGLASISVFGVLITLFIGTSLLNKEIDKKTIYLLLTKPMHRSQFIIGKHIGLSLTLLVIISLMAFAFYILLFFITKPSFIYMQAIILNYFELILLVAIAILFSTIAPPTMSAIYTLAIYLVGHFSKDLLIFGKMSGSPVVMYFTKFIYYAVPDLEKLNAKNLVIYNQSISPDIFWGGITYSLLYTAILLTLSVFIFKFKEF